MNDIFGLLRATDAKENSVKYEPFRPPITDRDRADAHDTANFVLAFYMKLWSRDHIYPPVKVTDIMPAPYVPVVDGWGWAHWSAPTERVFTFRPQGAEGEDRFAFEVAASVKNLSFEASVRQMEEVYSAARAAGAKDLCFDWDRHVVTGTYLYLDDHPDVESVRVFGTYSCFDSSGNRVPAQTTPYERTAR